MDTNEHFLKLIDSQKREITNIPKKRRKNSHLSEISEIILKNTHLTLSRFPGFSQIPTHKGKRCEKL